MGFSDNYGPRLLLTRIMVGLLLRGHTQKDPQVVETAISWWHRNLLSGRHDSYCRLLVQETALQNTRILAALVGLGEGVRGWDPATRLLKILSL